MITILGVGNILYGDEGFGVWFVKEYEDFFNKAYKNKVKVVDGGTMLLPLISYIEGSKYLYIIDAVSSYKHKPGDILFFGLDDLTSAYKSRVKTTAHSGGVQEILSTAELMNAMPENVELIGVVPADISTQMKLSDTMMAMLQRVKEILVEKIDIILGNEK